MVGFVKLALAALSLISFVSAAPIAPNVNVLEKRGSSYWVANIQRQGTTPFGQSGYQVYRDVTQFGATGNGVTDDTAAINAAISAGNRCGQGCGSSTTTPAIIYFPPGTYLISSPIVQLYFTQFIGDAINPPTLKASSNFQGIAMVDSDPYLSGGASQYVNQNNFYRQVRNFVFDMNGGPSACSGIHWQVAQATSLQNLVFNMKSGSSQQQGIFMDNGSGGFMSDLTFNGGNIGAFFGNQQFTATRMTFNGCNTGIVVNWDWLWTFNGLTFTNCGIGIDMSSNQAGSVMLQDSTFTGTSIGVKTSYSGTSPGTLIVDNVDFRGASTAIQSTSAGTLLAGGSVVQSWAQGHGYQSGLSALSSSNSQFALQGQIAAPQVKPSVLLQGNGQIFSRTKPQYQNYPASSFVSVKSHGAAGDGVTDDTAAIQNIFNNAQPGQVIYFDHGAYVISNTVQVPKDILITGEIWPMIMALGSAFNDENNPKPMFRVGNPGDVGTVEMSDLVFQTKGSAPGAILVEWNVNAAQPGSVGMWDCHWRIGGSAGTGLQSNTCKANANAAGPNSNCIGAFMLLHVTKTAGIYMENTWGWVADHELDLSDQSQIDVYNGRGFLIEAATGPVWMFGTAAEHSQLYNYQLNGANNVYMGAIQTETPYYQSNPTALVPFAPSSTYNDPTFASCTTNSCRKAWGLRIVGSSNVMVYGAGLYSFYDNYDQSCLKTQTCQDNMVSIEGLAGSVYLWGLSTIGSTNMVAQNGAVNAVPQSANTDTFCSTIAVFAAAGNGALSSTSPVSSGSGTSSGSGSGTSTGSAPNSQTSFPATPASPPPTTNNPAPQPVGENCDANGNCSIGFQGPSSPPSSSSSSSSSSDVASGHTTGAAGSPHSYPAPSAPSSAPSSSSSAGSSTQSAPQPVGEVCNGDSCAPSISW